MCGRYKNGSGTLYSLNYAHVSSIAADPIEKKPIYHFYHGSRCFSLGSWGCNFQCLGCQNWSIACTPNQAQYAHAYEISPEECINLAQAHNCHGISWTYNEPTMWLEYTHDAARLARKAGLYTAYVTNGYITTEALDVIGPYIQAWRLDVKGFNADTYQKVAKISDWQTILDSAVRAKTKWGMHVEIVTNIIPSINDDDQQLSGIAKWISSDLGELTPWHVTRFYPQHKMLDYPATPLATLEHARDIGHRAGLKFVYIGNMGTHQNTDTMCYSCQSLIIRRNGFRTDALGLNGSQCRYCGAELNFRA